MIVIVGAGPTGLALAHELARRGVPVRVLDRAEKASNLDRATILHPLTLEMLDRAGLVEPMLAGGIPLRRALNYSGAELISTTPMDIGDSRFRFDLSISQATVERVLRERLEAIGTSIEWGTEVTSLMQTADQVILNDTIEADWVIGCDGYHSTVRRILGEPFEGEDYPGTWAVLEAAVEGLPLAMDEVGIMAGHPYMWLAPMHPRRWRVIWVEDGSRETGPPTAEQALRALQTHFPGHTMRLSELSDQARFVAHKRSAAKLVHGRCLLAGDAAHAMSPAAAQGMNIGIHDAFNLGWKLARIDQGQSSARLLESYEPERRPCIEAGFQASHGAHNLLTAKDGSASFRRDELWRTVAALPAAQAWALNGNMELRMDFPSSPIVLGLLAQPGQPGHAAWAGPAPGERVPDEGPIYAENGTTTSLHRLMRNPEHTHLLLLGDSEQEQPDWFQGHVLTSRHDPGLYVHRRLGVQRDTLLVIRPDGYLGLRAEEPDQNALKSYHALLV